MALSRVRCRRLRPGHGELQLLRANAVLPKPRPSFTLGRDKASSAQYGAEDEQPNQVGVLVGHRYLRRSIVTPNRKKNKATPRTAPVQSAVGRSPSTNLSSRPNAATSTPISRIPSPIISATPWRSLIEPSRTTSAALPEVA